MTAATRAAIRRISATGAFGSINARSMSSCRSRAGDFTGCSMPVDNATSEARCEPGVNSVAPTIWALGKCGSLSHRPKGAATTLKDRVGT